MYLDSDFVTVRRIVLTEARELLEELEIDPPDTNPKGRLQESAPVHLIPSAPPTRSSTNPAPEHLKRFVAKIVWEGRELGIGEGRSKRKRRPPPRMRSQRLWTTPLDGKKARTENLPNNCPTTDRYQHRRRWRFEDGQLLPKSGFKSAASVERSVWLSVFLPM